MTDEIYYLSRLDAGQGSYFMTRLTGGKGIYYMHKPDSQIPIEEGEEGEEGVAPSYSWVLYGNETFVYTIPSPSWNSSPGDPTPGGWGFQLPPGAKYIKVVGYKSLGNACWKNTSGKYVGSMGVKTEVDYAMMGSGASYGTVAEAAAEWMGGEAILSLGSGRRATVGFTGSGASGYFGEYHLYYSM